MKLIFDLIRFLQLYENLIVSVCVRSSVEGNGVFLWLAISQTMRLHLYKKFPRSWKKVSNLDHFFQMYWKFNKMHLKFSCKAFYHTKSRKDGTQKTYNFPKASYYLPPNPITKTTEILYDRDWQNWPQMFDALAIYSNRS